MEARHEGGALPKPGPFSALTSDHRTPSALTTETHRTKEMRCRQIEQGCFISLVLACSC